METKIFVYKVGSSGSVNVIPTVRPFLCCVVVYKLKGNQLRELHQLSLSTVNYLKFWTFIMNFPYSIYNHRIMITMFY